MYGLVIHGLLTQDTDVAAIINDRVFPMMIPQHETYPAVVYTEMNGVPEYSKGISRVSKLDVHEVELDIFAPNYPTLINLEQAIRKVLEGYRGTIQNQNVRNIQLIKQREYYDHEAELFIKIAEYRISINK